MSTEERPEVVQCADDAYEAIRSLNRLISWNSVPAPLVHELLGDLKGIGDILPQALIRLAEGLGKSLHDYDVYEVDGGDPEPSIAIATNHLTRAAEFALQFGQELEEARSAIARQGYKKAGT